MKRIPRRLCVLAVVCSVCATLAFAGVNPEFKEIKIEPEMKNLTMEQKTAVQLAEKFLKEEKRDWGKPEKLRLESPDNNTFVGKGEQIYTLTYPTPKDEVLLISYRTIQVNLETKKTAFPPRK